ncbi:MAG: nuclear transport factor 2 family protein [Acidimicrobiales bacterium]
MSDVDVIRAIYDAMAERAFDRLFLLLHPDIVVTQDPALPWGGRHVGHDGFASFGLTLTSTIDSVVTTDAIFQAGDEVLQMGHTRGTVVATGAPFDCAEVHRWTLTDGLASTAHFAIDTPTMLEALAAPA